MPITDLTGYTWVGNSGVSIGGSSDSDATYNINFKSNNVEFSVLRYSATGYRIFYRINSSDSPGTSAYIGDMPKKPSLPSTTGTWVDEAYRTIEITGGTDATNSNLIAWLEANGTLTAPQPTPSTTNNIFFGTSTIDKVYFGTSEVSKIYYGNTLIYEVGEEPTPSGYSGNIVSESNVGSIEFSTYIKFDTAPTNAGDYDTFSNADDVGNGQIIGATSYSGKTKVYAWGNNIGSYLKVGNTIYFLEYETGRVVRPRRYDNPLEITLTENATITLGCCSSSGGGGSGY